jgi:hypothetical protein
MCHGFWWNIRLMKRMDNVRFGNDASYAEAIGQVAMEKAVIRTFQSRNRSNVFYKYFSKKI